MMLSTRSRAVSGFSSTKQRRLPGLSQQQGLELRQVINESPRGKKVTVKDSAVPNTQGVYSHGIDADHSAQPVTKVVDFLVLGSGIAGLSYALKVAEFGNVAVVRIFKFLAPSSPLDCSLASCLSSPFWQPHTRLFKDNDMTAQVCCVIASINTRGGDLACPFCKASFYHNVIAPMEVSIFDSNWSFQIIWPTYPYLNSPPLAK